MKFFHKPNGNTEETGSREPVGSLEVDGITAGDVISSIEMILGRTPEPGLVDYHLRLGFRDRFALGAYMLKTEEFRSRYETDIRDDAVTRPASIFLGDRVLTRTHRGNPIYLVPNDLDLTPSILLYGRWEPGVEGTIVKLLRPGDTAIDIGANVGYHTLAMAAGVGRTGHVHAFEANPAVARLLEATMFINGFDWVSVYQKAALDHAGTIKLAIDPAHFGSGHVVVDQHPASDYGTNYSNRVDVTGVTVDGELADRVERADLIHLDIEGSEPLALRGAAQLIARSPQVNIVTEWSVGMMGTRADVGEFVGWLVGLGFGLRLIEPYGRLTGVDPDRALGLPHCDLLLSRDGAS